MTDSTRRRYNPLDIRPGTAYPQGPRRPKRGPLPPAGPENRMFPAAPGAARSPQVPGQVPDRSTIPGHTQLPVPPATASIPPLTEFGTAQRIMQVFELKPGQEDNPARWEQATASYEEIRKADTSLLPPMRPGPGFNLVEGEVDLAMLPDGEGVAPALPPATPPEERPQTVSPSDAAVPDQAKGADVPAPGDSVSTGGTLPAAKATVTGSTAVETPVDTVPVDQPSASTAPEPDAAGAPAADRTTAPDVSFDASVVKQTDGERDQTQPSTMGLAATPEIVAGDRPPVAAGAESFDRVIDETSKPPDAADTSAIAKSRPVTDAGAASDDVVIETPEKTEPGAERPASSIAQPAGDAAPTAETRMGDDGSDEVSAVPEAGGEAMTGRPIAAVPSSDEASSAADSALDLSERGVSAPLGPDAGDADSVAQTGSTSPGPGEPATTPAPEHATPAAAVDQETDAALAPEAPAAATTPAATEAAGFVQVSGVQECPDGYPIKGNASSKIYHLPGTAAYATTEPEFCFANEAAAEAMGYRAPRRSSHTPRPSAPAVAAAEVADGPSSAETAPSIDLPGEQLVQADAFSAVDDAPAAAPAGATGLASDAAGQLGEPVISPAATTGEAADASDIRPAAARSLPSELASLPPGGWVAGDGSRVCPPGYPIKGNASSKIYHEPGQSSYDPTEPEICFESADAAVAAGFRPRKGGRRGAAGTSVAPASAPAATAEPAVPRPLDPRLARLPQTGWVPGDGSRSCPSEYPIKGNANSRIFHRPNQPSYRNTIPEVCFANDEAAKAAGFRPVRG